MSEPSKQHREAAAGRVATCAVVTVSDSRTPETDRGGDLLAELLTARGHRIAHRRLVADDPMELGRLVGEWIRDDAVEVIFATGGTGISRRDGTVEVVLRYLDKRLDGFGELFRMLSYEEIGAAAMLSRAVAGLAHDTLIFALPGSPAGVRLALERLVIPELPHLLFERSR